ncbi:MAG TPA: polyprenyl synthetase family protein [Burkholderiales bacterium]|nr:polyprenyl synthetase family protein [Burkholderiales bacterium]
MNPILGTKPAEHHRTAGATNQPLDQPTPSLAETTEHIIRALHLSEEMDRLRKNIAHWIDEASADIRDELRWQFSGSSKFFRPLTIFCCHRAISSEPIGDALMVSAQVLEMFHNVSLIIDDILDKSTYRRGKKTLHTRFGELRALMVAGYIVADGYEMVSRMRGPGVDSRYDIGLLSELLKRLGVAECVQWKLRRQPLGVADWENIAREDTGSMFEVCACLGARSDRLRRFGRYLGMLYHGCDDVGDVKGLTALGGGGTEDLRDGILTLPAALAIRDPAVRKLFCKEEPSEADLERLAAAFHAQIDEAERHLDGIAERARAEASANSAAAEGLLALVDHTRQLSKR